MDYQQVITNNQQIIEHNREVINFLIGLSALLIIIFFIAIAWFYMAHSLSSINDSPEIEPEESNDASLEVFPPYEPR